MDSSQTKRISHTLNGLGAAIAVGFLLLAHALPAASQGFINCVETQFSSLPSECETFSFEIEIDQISQTNGILGAVQAGDLLQGTYTVYNGTSDVDPLPDSGAYVNALECVTLNFDNRVLAIDLSPVEVEVPPSSSDVGILVLNDVEESTQAGSLFSDTVTFGMAGAGGIFFDDPDDGAIAGAGGFAFAYGDGCFAPFQSPCPPTLVTDDGLPGAPGDTTQLSSALMTFQFSSFLGEPASAQASIRSINTLPPIACPEPSFGLAIALGALSVGGLRIQGRTRGRSAA